MPGNSETASKKLGARRHNEARGIQIEVSDGNVTLSGPVRSWFEKTAILSTASRAFGVRKVINRMQISA
jgi:osmotically-inducible protein OsmY